MTILRAERLVKHFHAGNGWRRRGGVVHAVDDVSFEIGRGEIVALVGESGSGKSTIARLLALVYKPTSGEIYFEGKPVSGLRSRRAGGSASGSAAATRPSARSPPRSARGGPAAGSTSTCRCSRSSTSRWRRSRR